MPLSRVCVPAQKPWDKIGVDSQYDGQDLRATNAGATGSHAHSPEAALELGAAATAAFLTARPNTPGTLGKGGSPRVPLPHAGLVSITTSGSGTPLVGVRTPAPLHTFDPCLTDSEADSSYGGSDAEDDGLDHLKSKNLFPSPTATTAKPQGRSCADAGPLVASPLSGANGSTSLPGKGSAGAKCGGPAASQSLHLKGFQETEASPRDFTLKAHYGNAQAASGRTSSTLSSRIAMFESGANPSEGNPVFHTPHKSSGSPSRGWGGSSTSTASERAQDVPPVSVEEVRRRLVQSAMAQPPPSTSTTNTPRTGEPALRKPPSPTSLLIPQPLSQVSDC